MANEQTMDPSMLLADFQRNNTKMFRETSEVLVSRNIDVLKKSSDNQSAAMKTVLDQVSNVSKKTFEASKRGESKEAQSSIRSIEKLIQEKTGNFSQGEREQLDKIVQEISNTNKQLLNTENSMRNAVSSSLQENLPSLAGIMGTIGLDNPAFLFIGSMFQTLMDKRKKAKDERDAMLKQQHKDELNATMDLVEKQQETNLAKKESFPEENIQDSNNKENEDALYDIKENTGILEHIKGLITSLVQNSQTNEFAQIEKAREQTRANEEMQETMADVAANLEGLGDSGLGEASDGESLMDKITGIYDSMILSFIAVKGFIVAAGAKLLSMGKTVLKSVGRLAGAAKGLLKGAGRFLGPVGLIVSAGFALKAAGEGWNNAAEKLNKESATVTDKIASASGAVIGDIAGLADSFMGLFGIETDIGGYLNQKTTEILASFFDSVKAISTKVKDFFFGLLDVAFPEGFSLTELLKAPYRLIWGWWKNLFNLENISFPGMDTSIATLVETKTTELLNTVSNFFTDMYQTAKNNVMGLVDLVEEKFTFELPEFNIQETIKELFSKVTDIFKNFSVTDLLPDWMKGDKKIPNQDPVKVEDVINKNFLRKDEISDWKAVNEMSRAQLAKLQEYDDFNKETMKKLEEIAAKKQNDQMKEISSNAPLQKKDAATTYIKEKADKKESNKQQSPTVIKADKTNISNSSSTNNTISPASPRISEATISGLTLQTRAGH